MTAWKLFTKFDLKTQRDAKAVELKRPSQQNNIIPPREKLKEDSFNSEITAKQYYSASGKAKRGQF